MNNVCFSHFNCVCVFLQYFNLNLRHKWMSDIHCGKQTKLSKTKGVPISYDLRNN